MGSDPTYRTDLAYIHHHGFSEFAESAAPGVIEILRKRGVRDGLIVEVGCGSGVLARELTRAGYRVHGSDPSPAMIALARETAPEAHFAVAAFDAVDVPPCDAIVAMGEVFNHASLDAVRAFTGRAALREGGVLLFDVAERDAHPPYEEHRAGGEDWSVITIKEHNGERLTRRVLSFRKIGDDVQRDEEVHALELYDRAELVHLLRTHGFHVDVRRSYQTRRLPPGHAVYIASLRRKNC